VVRFPAGDGPAWRVVLTQGQLRADVPDRPDDRPLMVSTAVANVFARGGSFVVASAGPESARVEPMLGTVQVTRADDSTPVSVEAGGAAVVQPGFELVTIERPLRVSLAPRRALSFEAYPGIRDVMFSADGRDVWAATAKRLVRWTADGGTADTQFFPRAGNDGLVAHFTPDRSAIVTYRGERDDGPVIRDLPGGEERVIVPARVSEPRFLAVAPAGVWVATVDTREREKRRQLTVWDGTTGEARFTREVEEGISCLAATPDGRAVAVGVSDLGKGTHNKVVFFDAATGDRLFALPIQKKAVMALAFSPDGRYLAAGFNGLVQVWDVRSRELVRTIAGFERVTVRLVFSADGRRLAGGTQDGQVWVWSARTGNPVQQIAVGSRGVRALAFSPDGKSLVTVADKAPVSVWDVVPETPADRDDEL
jgi:uncharacterized cupin superfamily protein